VTARWLIWSPASILIVSAAAIPGGLLLFLLPLLALGYGVFSLVAWLGPRKETP
jgi:hypothetical protein